MTESVLIIGGYGVFGGYLARRLLGESNVKVVVAGRSLRKARAFCAAYGGTPLRLDTASDDLEMVLSACAPRIVVDASGPFQSDSAQTYRVAKAALGAGAHYLDLSDDGAFTAGIARLNDLARDRGLAAVSGASSVPAISSAACDALCKELAQVSLIETAILPGNRAPRGRAVMASILTQVGRPIRVWRGRRWETPDGWSLSRQETLVTPASGHPIIRRANLIGAPDLSLFPGRYDADSVLFRAGLELGVMHRGLSFLAQLRRWNLLPSARWSVLPLKWIAERLEAFGTDRGGMIVRVVGEHADGGLRLRTWTLIAEAGHGPHIPATPAWILIHKMLRSEIAPGARPCLGEFSLSELANALAPLKTSTHLDDEPFHSLFQTVLPHAWPDLPSGLTDLHTVAETRHWNGEASVKRGTGILSRIAGTIAGFPSASLRCPVEVTMVRTAKGETWTRRFGRSVFRSYLSRSRRTPAHLVERFGAMKFDIDLAATPGRLHFPVKRASIFGIPLPVFLRPKSETSEFVDIHGRICFDVAISLPLTGPVVHYNGWLRPLRPEPGDAQNSVS